VSFEQRQAIGQDLHNKLGMTPVHAWHVCQIRLRLELLWALVDGFCPAYTFIWGLDVF